jgi:hypothetical protein
MKKFILCCILLVGIMLLAQEKPILRLGIHYDFAGTQYFFGGSDSSEVSTGYAGSIEVLKPINSSIQVGGGVEAETLKNRIGTPVYFGFESIYLILKVYPPTDIKSLYLITHLGIDTEYDSISYGVSFGNFVLFEGMGADIYVSKNISMFEEIGYAINCGEPLMLLNLSPPQYEFAIYSRFQARAGLSFKF